MALLILLRLTTPLSEEQIGWFMAGSALNKIKKDLVGA